jgi:hypothetical protein
MKPTNARAVLAVPIAFLPTFFLFASFPFARGVFEPANPVGLISRKQCHFVPNRARHAVSPRKSRGPQVGIEVPNCVKPVSFGAKEVPKVPNLTLGQKKSIGK